jgi:hypothetical protein
MSIGLSSRGTTALLTFCLCFLSANSTLAFAAPPLTAGFQTLVRTATQAPVSLRLSAYQAFVLYGFSLTPISVKFTKDRQTFEVTVTSVGARGNALVGGNNNNTPLRGPAVVTISGSGLVSYEVTTIR